MTSVNHVSLTHIHMPGVSVALNWRFCGMNINSWRWFGCPLSGWQVPGVQTSCCLTKNCEKNWSQPLERWNAACLSWFLCISTLNVLLEKEKVPMESQTFSEFQPHIKCKIFFQINRFCGQVFLPLFLHRWIHFYLFSFFKPDPRKKKKELGPSHFGSTLSTPSLLSSTGRPPPSSPCSSWPPLRVYPARQSRNTPLTFMTSFAQTSGSQPGQSIWKKANPESRRKT